MTLRLVHPAREGQSTRPSQGIRASALGLTDEEVRHLRNATRNAIRAFGGVDVLASVLAVRPGTVYAVTAPKGRRPGAVFAIRLAKATGLSVEAIIGLALSEAGRCSTCGARIGAGRAAS